MCKVKYNIQDMLCTKLGLKEGEKKIFIGSKDRKTEKKGFKKCHLCKR